MNTKRTKDVKPLLNHAFLQVMRDDQNRLCVKQANVRGLGDIHELMAETFQSAVAARIFDQNPHITRVFFTPPAANDRLPHPVVNRPDIASGVK